ncbi:MAG: hypothetical protein GF320_22980 [Armatimonadia bacterium]|nr:hypothetical protein [Armatimonadia bacterium]
MRHTRGDRFMWIGVVGVSVVFLVLVIVLLGRTEQPKMWSAAIVTVVLVFVAILRDYRWGLVLLVLLVPWFFADLGATRRFYSWELPALVCVFGLALHQLLPKSDEVKALPQGLTAIDKAFIALVIVELIGAVVAYIGGARVIGAVIKPIEYSAVYLVCRVGMREEKWLRRVLWAFLVVGAAQALVGIAQHMGWTDFRGWHTGAPWWLSDRYFERGYLGWLGVGSRQVMMASGTMMHFNHLGAFLNLCWPAAVPLIRHTKGGGRTFAWILLAIIIVGVIKTYSRGSMLAAIVSFCLILLFVPRPGEGGVGKLGAVFMLLISAAALHWAMNSDYSATLSLDDRSELWDASIAGNLGSNPIKWLVGSGAMAAGGAVHSGYVALLVSYGLVGAAAALALWVSMMAAGLKARVQESHTIWRDLCILGAVYVAQWAAANYTDAHWAQPQFRAPVAVLMATVSAAALRLGLWGASPSDEQPSGRSWLRRSVRPPLSARR